MKSFLCKTVFLVSVIQLTVSLLSYGQFSIDAQLRPRFEIRDGYQHMIPDSVSPAFVISQRTRLSFAYENKFLKVRITPQDVRVWGDEQLVSSTGVFGDAASLDLFEGYLQLRLGRWGWLSAGRQQLFYDSERLLSARNWNQTGISYDAVVAKMTLGGWNLHVGGSWNTLCESYFNNYYPSNRFKSLDFLWLNREFTPNIKGSLLHVASAVTHSDTTNLLYWRQSTGLWGDFRWRGLKAWFDCFYQYGRNPQGIKVSAFLFDVNAGYTIGGVTPGLGVSYLSGNKQTGSAMTRDHLFNVLYGNRHGFFGNMDYFRNFAVDTKQGGLIDYFIFLKFDICKGLTLSNTSHYFELAQTNSLTPSTRDLGFENDLILKYSFLSWGALESGYCFLLPTTSLKSMQDVPYPRFPQFFYLQLTISPTLFTFNFNPSDPK
ncbi:MAG: alginate export family protein [bacterium]